MKTILENSSQIGTVVNPDKVEGDEQKPKRKNKKESGDEKAIVPNVTDKIEEEDDENEDNKDASEKSFRDANNGME